MRDTHVIELLGAAASGKSGLATALARTPGTVVVKDHDLRDLPHLLWGATRSWPVLFEDPPAGATRLRWAAWAGRLSAAPALAGRHAPCGGLVVLDQGPAYTLTRMVSVRGTPRGSHWWHRQACGTARLLDVLVVLETDPQTLSRRLHARPKEHRATVLDVSRTRDYLEIERGTCRVVADAIARTGTPVVYLDTGRLPLPEQVTAVHTALNDATRRNRSCR